MLSTSYQCHKTLSHKKTSSTRNRTPYARYHCLSDYRMDAPLWKSWWWEKCNARRSKCGSSALTAGIFGCTTIVFKSAHRVGSTFWSHLELSRIPLVVLRIPVMSPSYTQAFLNAASICLRRTGTLYRTLNDGTWRINVVGSEIAEMLLVRHNITGLPERYRGRDMMFARTSMMRTQQKAVHRIQRTWHKQWLSFTSLRVVVPLWWQDIWLRGFATTWVSSSQTIFEHFDPHHGRHLSLDHHSRSATGQCYASKYR